MEKKGIDNHKKKSNSISENLIDKHRSLKRKLDKAKAKKIKEGMKKLQTVPKINQKSRRMASESQTNLITSENRIRRTHEILKNSRFMPKKLKLSLQTLRPSTKTINPSPQALRYDLQFTTPQAQSPITFPSLAYLTELTVPEDLVYLPSDITQRNKLLLSLKSKGFDTEIQEPDYLDLPLQQRTTLWLKKKQDRIKSIRKQRESSKLEDCSFRPSLMSSVSSKRSTPRVGSLQSSFSKGHLRTRSQVSVHSGRTSITLNRSQNEDNDRIMRQFSTSGSSTLSLNNICPVPLTISYHSGYPSTLRANPKRSSCPSLTPSLSTPKYY